MATAAQIAKANTPSESRNAVYTVLFPFGSSSVDIGDAEAAKLIDEARDAPLIVLHGRTDGIVETLGEGRIARNRAEAVQALLVQAGVEPGRIRTTWQPVGDHAADNGLPGGRALNRRVEIEIYRAAPQAAATFTSTPPHGQQPAQPPIGEAPHGHKLQ